MRRRLLPLALLCAGTCLSTAALADNSCLTPSSDTAVSFPDGSYDYIFAVNSDGNGGYKLCFWSPTTLNLSNFSQAGIADVDGDHWQDLVYGERSSGGGQVQVFLNDGAGSGIVVAGAIMPTGGSTAPNILGTPDLDGDSAPDILAANGPDGTVSVMLNDGTGAFPTVKQYAAGSKFTVMAALDLDGDGFPDIATNDTTRASVDVLMNKGTGDFKTAVQYAIGSIPTYMRVQDLDGDGYPDIVTGSGQNVSVLINKGDGSFAPAVNYYTSDLMYISVMDVNKDGKPDIVVAANYQASEALYAMTNNGDGTFAPPAWFVIGATNSGTTGVILSGGNGTLIGGITTPIPVNTYSSGSGTIKLPTDGNQAVVVAASSKSKTSTGGSTTGGSTQSSAAADSSGGGAMDLLSLALVGLMGIFRRKRA